MDQRKIFLVLMVIALSASDRLLSEKEGDGDSEALSRKERFLLATLKFRNERCQIGTNKGVCKSWKECWLQRGNSVGQCPLGHGVCCSIQYTCGNVTSERVSYFVNPNPVPQYCSLRVNVYDRRVTQIRLDFEEFSLEQPQNTGYNAATDFPAYTCDNDTFTVSSSSTGTSGNLGFVNLCGENKGQHIYVPVNATSGSATVELAFTLADRTQDNRLIQPRWKILITQIDCCAPDTKYLCAPLGCLQYYPERSGTFESFNYNNGNGHYQGGLNYAICFKRYDGVCSNQYTPVKSFQLAADDMAAPYGTFGCNQATIDPNILNSQDYLFIPDGRIQNPNINASYFCGNQLINTPITTNAPGPMFVYFRTDGIADPINLGEEIGFSFRYSQSGSGCYSMNRFFG